MAAVRPYGVNSVTHRNKDNLLHFIQTLTQTFHPLRTHTCPGSRKVPVPAYNDASFGRRSDRHRLNSSGCHSTTAEWPPHMITYGDKLVTCFICAHVLPDSPAMFPDGPINWLPHNSSWLCYMWWVVFDVTANW